MTMFCLWKKSSGDVMLRKTIFRTIRSSLGRYVAILAIIALGVGFFAGVSLGFFSPCVPVGVGFSVSSGTAVAVGFAVGVVNFSVTVAIAVGVLVNFSVTVTLSFGVGVGVLVTVGVGRSVGVGVGVISPDSHTTVLSLSHCFKSSFFIWLLLQLRDSNSLVLSKFSSVS